MRAWQYILCIVALCSTFSSSIAIASEVNVLMTSEVGRNAGASPTFSPSLNGTFLSSLDGKIYFVPKRVSFWGSSSVNVSAELFIDLNVGVVSTIALSHDETSLYVTALDGRLYSIDVSARKVRWAFPSSPRFGAQTRSSSAIDLDGNIFFGDSLGNFYSVKPDGTELFPSILIPDDTEIGSSPTVALDGNVYFGSSAGKYYRFSPVDGLLEELESSLEGSFQASVASTSTTLSGDLIKARKNSGLYKEFDTSEHKYTPAPLEVEKISPQVAPDQGAVEFGLEVLAANNELIGDDEFSFFASGAKIYAISYGGYEVASFDVASQVPNASNMSLSAPAVVSNDNGKYVIYYATSSEQLFEQGSVFGLEFDGSEFTLLWSFEQDYNKYRHYASGPIIDPDGDVHVVTTEGAYALLEGAGQSPLFWGMFGGGFEHRRSLPDFDRDGCPDAIDMFSNNPLECRDNDADGIGDHADLDDDQDGIPDVWENAVLQPIWDAEDALTAGDNGFVRKRLASKTFSAFDDKDQDGLQDYIEYQLGGSPALGSNDKVDADGDGFYDLWEVRYSTDADGQGYVVGVDETIDTNGLLHPLNDADSDGVSNLDESLAFTNPFLADTDGDSITDALELSTVNNYYESFTDLSCEDGNSDGLIDIDRTSFGLNPLNGADGGFDFDCDGYTNAEELNSVLDSDYALNEFDDRVTTIEGLIQSIDPEGFRTSASSSFHEWSTVSEMMVSSDGTKFVLFSGTDYWVFDRDTNTGELTANEKLRAAGDYQYFFSNGSSGFPRTLDKAKNIIYFLDNSSGGFAKLKSLQFDSSTHLWIEPEGQPELIIPVTDDLAYAESSGELILPSSIDHGSTLVRLSQNGRYLGIAPGTFAGVLIFEISLDGSFTFVDHINTPTNTGDREEFHISNDGELVFINWRSSGDSFDTQVFLKSNGRFGDVNGLPGQPLASTRSSCFGMYPGLHASEVLCDVGYNGYRSLRASVNDQTLLTINGLALGEVGYFIGSFPEKNILLQKLNAWSLNNEGYYERLGAITGLSSYVTGAVSPDYRHLYISSPLYNSERLVNVFPFPVSGNGRPDLDGDGVEDKDDKFVDDPRFASDIDNDGRPDDFVASCDASCQAQSGFPELALDQDDDGDGFPDFDINGGIVDETDFFPDDPLAWQDTDRDGMPDSLIGCDLVCTAYSKYTIDTDDDNDGFDDVRQASSGQWEAYDQFPKDAQEWFDTDSDGIGNNADLDDDGDGIPDDWEVQFGLNPYDARDANEDLDLSPKIGGGVYKTPDRLVNLGEFLAGANPYLSDTDLDGYLDINDVFATDSSEWSDLDGDNIGDNSDPDGDGDEIVDAWESYYSDPANTFGNPTFDSLSNNATEPNAHQQTAPLADPDGDGASNQLESQFGTNPYLVDSDDDGLDDLYEITYSKGPLVGGSSSCEYSAEGLPTRFAASEGLLPNDFYSPDTYKDNDCDRYSNTLEYELGFNPLYNEFDDHIVWDAEQGQRLARIVEADAMEAGRPWLISDSSQLLLLGDEYLVGSHPDSPIFKYNKLTGQLAWVGQVTFPWNYSSENFLNTAAAPDGSGFYVLKRNYISKYIFDGETSFSAPTKVASNIPFIGNISTYRPDDLQNQDKLPLSHIDEYIDTRTLNSDPAARLQNRLTFNESGDLLFWATVGESGVLVYDRSPSGALNFLMHLTDDDQLDEYGALIKHTERASVIASDALDAVIVASPFGTGTDVAIYQKLASGLFGSDAGPNIALATTFVQFKVRDIHPGLQDDEFIVAGDNNTYSVLVWDAAQKEFKVHSDIFTDESFTGVSRVNGVAQFGLTSFVRKEVPAIDEETGDAWTQVVYEKFHSSVDILRNECIQENILGCTGYGEVELTSWPGSSVMMPNGRHRYYLEKRGLYPEHIGVIGLPVDHQGLGRPDQDGDGVEDLFDHFVNNPLEWLDTDQDGIGNNADPDDDNDGLSDIWEQNNCRLATGTSECDSENPLFHPLIAELSENGDFDGDGLTNIEEVRLGTDPRKKDTDGDLVWDSWEFVIESDPLVFDSNLDPDLDGYTNLRESQLGTPIYLNTFDSRPSTLLSAYDALDVTDSGLQMPDISEQSVLSIANDGRSFVVADSQAIHFFTKDDTAVVSYWKSESLPDVNSMALSFNATSDGLSVFYTNSSGEPYRRSYTVDLAAASLVLEEEVPLSIWDGISPLSSEEYGAAYFANKIYVTDDNRFLYVQAEGLGLLRYRQRSDRTLTFDGYESSFSTRIQSAVFSDDFDQSKFYQLNVDQLEVYLRDQATGELTLSQSVFNAELVDEQIEEIAFGTNSELLLSGDSQIASLAVGVSSSNKRVITSPGGELELNDDLSTMRYVLGTDKLKTYTDDGTNSSLFDELALEHQGVSVAPITSDLENRGNYLFVIATNNVDAQHLLIYQGAIEGTGSVDSDNDGVLDADDALPYNPNESIDDDGDGCGDLYEDKFLGDIDRCLDTDQDGLSNEVDDTDDDNDGLTDIFENAYAATAAAGCEASTLSSTNATDVNQDIDGDGLSYLAEQDANTDPCNADTDGDSIPDGQDALPLSYSLAPTIELIGEPIMEVERGLKLRSAEDTGFVDPMAVANDPRYGDIGVPEFSIDNAIISSGVVVDYSSVDFDNVGIYEAVYSITLNPHSDQATALNASVTRQIQVVDTLPPEMVLKNGMSLRVEQGPNYSDWAGYISHNRTMAPSFADVYVADAHATDQSIVTTITYKGTTSPVDDWTLFDGSLEFDGSADYCVDSVGGEVKYNCIYITYFAADDFGNESTVQRLVRVYPQEAPEFALRDMPTCEVGGDVCQSSVVAVASDNAFVPRAPDKFEELDDAGLESTEPQEIIQTWSPLVNLIAQDNVDGNLEAQVTAKVISYQTSSSEENVPQFDLTNYGSGQVQYQGPKGSDYYLEDNAGNRSSLSRLDRYITIGDNQSPELRLCGRSRDYVELGEPYIHAPFPLYDDLDTNNRYKSCDEVSIAFFAEDASDGYLLACADGQTAGCVEVRYSSGFDIDAPSIGEHDITYIAKDKSNASEDVTLVRVVEVVPQEDPTIKLVGANPLLWNQNAPYIDPGVVLTDNSEREVTLSVDDGDVNVTQAGMYEVRYTATDVSGNSAEATRTIDVRDISAPIIRILGNNPAYVVNGQSYVDLGAYVSDNVRVVDYQPSGPPLEPNFDSALSGTYQVTYRAVDEAGNETMDTRDVIVGPEDNEPPTLVLTDQRATFNSGTYFINHNQGELFEPIQVEAFDNVMGDLRSSVERDGLVDVYVPGVYQQVLTVRDQAGNRSVELKVSVSVRDNEAPVITLNGEESLYVDPSDSLFIDPNGSVTDNIDGDIEWSSVQLSIEFDNGESIELVESVDLEQVGKYTVTYSATDSSGNKGQAKRYVYSLHPQEPFLSLIGGSPLYVEQNSDFIDPGVTVIDLQDALLSSDDVTIVGSVDTSLPGEYQRFYSVTDSDGNESSVSRVFIVADRLEPLLTLIGPSTLTLECGVPANDPGASAHDMVDGDLTPFITVDQQPLNEKLSVNVGSEQSQTREYQVSDLVGNTAALSRVILVEDRNPPTIQLSQASPFYVEAGALFVEPAVSANDLCSGDVPVNKTGSVNTSALGSYVLSYNASDQAGLEADEVMLEVVVRDTLPPTLTVNPELIMQHEQGIAFVDPGATASDLFDGDVTSQITVEGTVNVNVAGSYDLIYQVSDSSGNTSPSVTRTVIVSDTTPPTITLLGDPSINHEQMTSYTDEGATANDSVDGDLSASIVVTSDVDDIVAGTYTVTYNVSDAAGNAATPVTRSVTVADTIAPVLTLTGEETVNVEQGTSYEEQGATAIDLVDGDLAASILVGGDTVDVNVAGTYTVTYSVVDTAGNAAVPLSRTVIVSDTTPPTITLNGLASIEHEQGIAYTDAGATANDSVDGDLTASIVVTSNVNDAVAGTYAVTYNVSDAAGNAATPVTRTVIVADTAAPGLSLIGAATVTVEQGTSYLEQGATANDTVDGDLTATIVVGGDTVDANVVGAYVVTYNVSDVAGNAAEQVSRTVIVADSTAPTITLLGDASINVEQMTGYIDAGATANDSVDGDLTASIVVTSNVNDAVAGTYAVTYNVSDAAGNAATPVTRTVIVADTTAPVLSLTGAATVTVEQGTSYLEQGATANDAVDGDLTATIVVGGESVDVSVAGTYVVTYNVSDLAGNAAAQVSRTVIVADTTAPTITLLGDVSISVEQMTGYIDAGATANDSVDGDLSASLVVISNVNDAVAGTYTVTYNVSDAAGNAASPVTRTVTVADTTAPVLSLTGAATVTVEQGTSYIEQGAAANDSVDGNVTANIVVGGDSVNANVAGTYIVSYNVSDVAGNTALSLNRTVIVSDTTPPTITLNGFASVDHEQGVPYSDAGAIANDSIDGDISNRISIDLSNVDVNQPGQYNVVYSVVDSAGNFATRVRQVNILDSMPPSITLLGDTVVQHELGNAYVDAHVSASDSVDGDLAESVVVQSDVNVNSVGDYTITYTVSDSAGNQSEMLVRQVLVRDTVAPELSLLGDLVMTLATGETYVEPGYSASDLGADISHRVVVEGSVDTQLAGSYVLTYSVSDDAGNAATPQVRTVIVGEVFEIEADRAYLPAANGIEFTFIPFRDRFEEAPVVFALIDNTNSEPATIRIRNVTATGFEAAQVEAGSGRAQPEGITPAIEFPYLAVERGLHSIAPGVDIEVGTVDITNNVGRSIAGTTSYRNIAMNSSFASPVVLGQIQSTNNALVTVDNSLFLTTSVNSVTNSSFKLALERSEVSIGSVVQAESVGYLVINSGVQFDIASSQGEPVKVETLGPTNKTLSGDLVCNVMSFAHFYSELPLLIASHQTRKGNNGGWLRQCAITTSTAGVLIQEDWTDTEIYHVPENVGALVIERPFSAKVNN